MHWSKTEKAIEIRAKIKAKRALQPPIPIEARKRVGESNRKTLALKRELKKLQNN